MRIKFCVNQVCEEQPAYLDVVAAKGLLLSRGYCSMVVPRFLVTDFNII